MAGRYGKSRIYYADGSYRDEDEDNIPKIGVICIIQWIGGARRILHGNDFYWQMDLDEWAGGDRHGCDMYLMTSGFKKVYFGVMVNSHIFNAIVNAASHDPEYPKIQVK